MKQAAIRKGFTLVEVMIAVSLLGLLMGGVFGVYLLSQRTWHSTVVNMAASRDASTAVNRLVYGSGGYSGLRNAAKAETLNAKGYWLGTNYPPSPGDGSHYLAADQSSDGSWRLVFSNKFDGTRWIDYNRSASNIVFWPDTNSASSRQLICNNVFTASVSAASNRLSFSVSVLKKDGRFSALKRAATSLKLRNQ